MDRYFWSDIKPKITPLEKREADQCLAFNQRIWKRKQKWNSLSDRERSVVQIYLSTATHCKIIDRKTLNF